MSDFSSSEILNNSDLVSRQVAIDALKICDNNEDGINCYKCPLRDERWDGAWQDDETSCYRKLMRDSAELLSAQPEPAIQPEAKEDWLYDYLVGRLGKSIVDNKEEFHKWFERMVWHVKRCDELSEERRSRQWIPCEKIQPEEAIPVSWIEAKITQLISMDNEFAGLVVHIIKTLLNEWKRESRKEGQT